MKKKLIWVSIIVTLMATIGISTSHAQESAETLQSLQDQITELSEKLEALKTEQVVSAEPAGNDFRVHWKEGLRFDSNNGDFKLKFGGRIQNDWGWFSEGDDIKDALGSEAADGTEFRRARLFIGGTIYEDFEFKSQFDFEDAEVDIKDLWIAAKNVPVLGKLKIGHFKEPFGLEELTSSKDDSFMEQGLGSAFAPGRNTGIGFSKSTSDKRTAWAAGIFEESGTDGEGNSDNSDDKSITARITHLPIYNEAGDQYLHLGLSLSHRDVDEYSKKSKAEAHMGSTLVSVTVPDADTVDLIGTEIAYTHGPLHLSAEYTLASVDADSGAEDADFSGYYAQVGYFLTGEHRRYKLGSGVFDKVRPNENFGIGEDGGLGAWEVVARLSQIDLEDSGYTGGELTDYSLGLTWYLNPNMKILLNYIHGELEDGMLGKGEDDDVDTVQTRFQVTW